MARRMTKTGIAAAEMHIQALSVYDARGLLEAIDRLDDHQQASEHDDVRLCAVCDSLRYEVERKLAPAREAVALADQRWKR